MIAGSGRVSSRRPAARFTCKSRYFGDCRTPLASATGDGSGIALAKSHELPLAGLQHGSVEAAGVELELADRLAVETDASLADHPPPVARRLAEPALEQLGQIHDPLDLDLGQLVRRLVTPDDAREVLLRGRGGFRPVRARHDPARELELRLH